MNHISSKSSDHQIHHHYSHPSFSSSLLEQIYRSFDDDDDDHRHTTNNRYTNKNTSTSSKSGFNYERAKHNDMLPLTRFDLDEWRQENINNNNKKNKNNHHHHHHHHRRSSMEFATTTATATNCNFPAKLNYSSSSSSSDSSSGICGFSSSDAESLCGSTKSKNLKPIKTAVINPPEFHRKSYSDELSAKSSKSKQGNLQKRALKLYGDLKKVKQPISPGGKLASFLNSLFNTSNSSSSSSKKPKISSSTSSKTASSNGVKYSSTSTPSTASSYSRSCLSKTPSSAGRFERRSVRFCPESTVMAYSDERDDNKASRDEVLKVQIKEKQRRVEEVAKELLKNYHHGRKFQTDVNNHSHHMKKSNNNTNIRGFEDEDEDEDDDDVSCCSSDLFELDHLLEVGGHQRYCEELPVYETTHVDTNRAIAKGFIL